MGCAHGGDSGCLATLSLEQYETALFLWEGGASFILKGQKYSEGIFLSFTEENGMLALCASLTCLKLLAVSSPPLPPCPASPLLLWLTPLLLSPALLSWVLPSLVSGHFWVLLWVLKPSSRREIQKGVTKRLGVASHPWLPACYGTCHGGCKASGAERFQPALQSGLRSSPRNMCVTRPPCS